MGGPDCKTPGCIQKARIAGMCQKCFAGNNPIPALAGGFTSEVVTLSRDALPDQRPTFPAICIDLAKSISRRSTCSRLQVGCVITSTDFRKVIAWGYNGGASGLENECASLDPGACLHIHAEANALINCDVPRSTEKLIFTTDLPCIMCSKMIINLGNVKKVTYARDYRIKDGLELLKRAGIETEMFK